MYDQTGRAGWLVCQRQPVNASRACAADTSWLQRSGADGDLARQCPAIPARYRVLRSGLVQLQRNCGQSRRTPAKMPHRNRSVTGLVAPTPVTSSTVKARRRLQSAVLRLSETEEPTQITTQQHDAKADAGTCRQGCRSAVARLRANCGSQRAQPGDGLPGIAATVHFSSPRHRCRWLVAQR